MKLDWRILFCAIVLTGCKPTETGVSHRDILDDYKALNIRVDSLAHPLLAANQDICDQTVDDNGIRWHQLDDYPEDLQPVAQSYWDVDTDRSVFYVLPGSDADKAGIKAGDRPTDSQLEAVAAKTVCKYAVLVSYIEEVNAYATGNEIIITSGMMRSINDNQYLTLVLSHELSHNILNHIDNPNIEDREAEADLAAVKLMARAGLDFEAAVSRREAYQREKAVDGQLSIFEQDRIAKLKTYSNMVKSKQDKSEALWP